MKYYQSSERSALSRLPSLAIPPLVHHTSSSLSTRKCLTKLIVNFCTETSTEADLAINFVGVIDSQGYRTLFTFVQGHSESVLYVFGAKAMTPVTFFLVLDR